MKLKNLHIIYILIGALSFFACSEDHVVEEQAVECCVRMDWSNGRGGGTRTLSSLLAAEGEDLEIDPKDYPEVINVKCNGKDFTLSKPEELEECSTHAGFYQGYISSYELKDNEAKKGVTATASIDGGQDELYSEVEDVVLDGLHLLFTMHHSKALLRFGFKVNKDYDKIRYIVVTEIELNGTPCSLEEKVLNKDGYLYVAYLYADPFSFNTSDQNTIKCTYNIYDKDAIFDGEYKMDDETLASHLTREGVTATNTFKFSSLKDAGGSSISQLQPGYYYDLNVTINPDYLYVLSEHDNKQHITIE